MMGSMTQRTYAALLDFAAHPRPISEGNMPLAEDDGSYAVCPDCGQIARFFYAAFARDGRLRTLEAQSCGCTTAAEADAFRAASEALRAQRAVSR